MFFSAIGLIYFNFKYRKSISTDDDILRFSVISGYVLADGGALAPAAIYAAVVPASGLYGSPSDVLVQYGDNDAAASDLNGVLADAGNGIEDLKNNIPGVPGEDYPILAEVPELSFTCDGRVAGGKQLFENNRH